MSRQNSSTKYATQICEECGEEFKGHHIAKVCSVECKRAKTRKKDNETF